MITIDNICDEHVRKVRKLAKYRRDVKMMEFCDKMFHCESGAFSASFAVVRYYNQNIQEN